MNAIEKLKTMGFSNERECATPIARLAFQAVEELSALQSQADECRKLLGYDDGNLLDNVTRYKKYAEDEISLLKEKANIALAYFKNTREMAIAASKFARCHEDWNLRPLEEKLSAVNKEYHTMTGQWMFTEYDEKGQPLP